MAMMESGPRLGTVEGIARSERVASMIAGLWLAVSMSLMRIPTSLKMTYVAAGVAVVVLALAARFVEPRLRIANTVIAVLLFGSIFVLPIGQGLVMLDVLLAATVVFGCSVAPDGWRASTDTVLRRPEP